MKAEVLGCDVVAYRGDEPSVIVELKTRFNLDLLLQTADRFALSERVYIAFCDGLHSGLKGRRWGVLKLCRMLGLGVLLVNPSEKCIGYVTILQDPEPGQPRQNPRRAGRLLKEFIERIGDPNIGGMTRRPFITAYRQTALRLVARLEIGEANARNIVSETGVSEPSTVLQRNVYGWFERVARGVYGLSPKGRPAADQYREVVERVIAA